MGLVAPMVESESQLTQFLDQILMERPMSSTVINFWKIMEKKLQWAPSTRLLSYVGQFQSHRELVRLCMQTRKYPWKVQPTSMLPITPKWKDKISMYLKVRNMCLLRCFRSLGWQTLLPGTYSWGHLKWCSPRARAQSPYKACKGRQLRTQTTRGHRANSQWALVSNSRPLVPQVVTSVETYR